MSINGKLDKFPIDMRQNLPKRLMSKWPATMLADKRTERVIGRIKFLTISMRTIKFISWMGVPVGTKWAIMLEKFLLHPINMKENQKVRAKVNEIDKWAVGVKQKGVRAIKFIIRDTEKILNRSLAANFFSFGYMRDDSSLLRKVHIVTIVTLKVPFSTLLLVKKSTSKGIRHGTQAKLANIVDGSNIENKFIIIVKRFLMW